MSDPVHVPEGPHVVETVRFLRRFADLMSNGQNADWLLNAASLLETLSGRVIDSMGEAQAWRDKHGALAQDHDRLEDECEALRNDIAGHLDLSRTLLGDRDTMAETLQARDAELGAANQALAGAREQLAAEALAQKQTFAQLRDQFDRERQSLSATIAARDEEIKQLRETLQDEREKSAQQLQSMEAKLAELQLGFGRERDELQSRLTSGEGLIATLRSDAERDSEWMKARISALETQRVELRAALDRLGEMQTQAAGSNQGSADRPASAADPETSVRASSDSGSAPAHPEGRALVPVATLRHARAQFEYLAKDCIRRGDVATQVMCELSAHTLEMALKEAERAEQSPAGRIALSILEPEQAASVVSDPA